MPHLSPLPWFLLPIILWLFLLMFMVQEWYTPHSNLTSLPSLTISSPIISPWYWS